MEQTHDLQSIVKEFNEEKSKLQEAMPVHARLLDLWSETGELAKEFLKPTSYGTKDFTVTNDFKLEFGDCLYCLLSLAEETNIDARECLNMVVEKYRNRLNKGKTMDSRVDKI